ncbi:hypothetical protein ACFL2J_06515 [Candidatus Omnitrophota bacterium]
MKKFAATLLFLLFVLISIPETSQAGPPRRMQYEDTVGEAIWDWATTLGKSPREKKSIKAHRRARRIKARVEKKAKIERARREKESIAREKKTERIRNARIKARRREIAERKR